MHVLRDVMTVRKVMHCAATWHARFSFARTCMCSRAYPMQGADSCKFLEVQSIQLYTVARAGRCSHRGPCLHIHARKAVLPWLEWPQELLHNRLHALHIISLLCAFRSLTCKMFTDTQARHCRLHSQCLV